MPKTPTKSKQGQWRTFLTVLGATLGISAFNYFLMRDQVVYEVSELSGRPSMMT